MYVVYCLCCVCRESLRDGVDYLVFRHDHLLRVLFEPVAMFAQETETKICVRLFGWEMGMVHDAVEHVV